MIKIGMRPRRLSSARTYGIILDHFHPDYVSEGPSTWIADCPVCGDWLMIIVGDIEDRPDDVTLWCWGGCTEEESYAPVRRALQAEAMRDPQVRRHVPETPEEAVRYPDPPRNLSEGERNRAMFGYACALRRIGLDMNGILRLLEDANVACSPPLHRRALLDIARSASKYPVDLNVTRTSEPNLRQRLMEKLGSAVPRAYDPRA